MATLAESITAPDLAVLLQQDAHPGFFAHPRSRLLPTMATALARLIPSAAASSLLPRFTPLDGLTDTYSDPCTNCNSYSYPNTDTYTHADTNPYSDPFSDTRHY